MFSAALFPVVFSGALDPEVAAWRSAIVANGGSVSGGVVAQVARFVRGCKADGVWNSLLDVGLFAGVDNLAAAAVKLKMPSGVQRVLTFTNLVSADHTPTGPTAGILGNGTSKYAATGFIPNNHLSVGSGCLGVYTRTDRASCGDGAIGCEDGSGIFGSHLTYNDTKLYSDLWDAGGGRLSVTPPSGPLGHICFSRISTTDHKIYLNGAQIATKATNVSTPRPTNDAYLFRKNGSAIYSTARLSCYYFGTGLTATQVASLNERLVTLMTAFGAN